MTFIFYYYFGLALVCNYPANNFISGVVFTPGPRPLNVHYRLRVCNLGSRVPGRAHCRVAITSYERQLSPMPQTRTGNSRGWYLRGRARLSNGLQERYSTVRSGSQRNSLPIEICDLLAYKCRNDLAVCSRCVVTQRFSFSVV